MKDFKKYFFIPAPPEDIYLALTNPNTIHLWSGDKAEMSTEPGSEFSLWDGSITGKNLEFESGKKIVQEWYFGEQAEKSIAAETRRNIPRSGVAPAARDESRSCGPRRRRGVAKPKGPALRGDGFE